MKPTSYLSNPLAIAAAVITGFILVSPSAHAQIVYQDNFDNDGVETNTGIGGGLLPYNRQGDSWLDNGDLDSNRGGNNDRGNVSSLNTFNLTGGFKLEVTHTINNVTTIDANRAVIGLLDAADLPETQTNTTYITDFLNRDLDNYGIGLNLTIQNSTQGLNFADGANLNLLSNAQTITAGTQSWVLEVDADGNWAYSIDGAPATSGTSTFEVARDYHFFAYMQDNHNGLVLNSVTLTIGGGGSASFAITEIDYDPVADTVTLTWVSDAVSEYIAKFSTDMTNWDFDMGDSITMALDDEVPDDGDHLTKTFSLADFDIGDEADLFFRIEK